MSKVKELFGIYYQCIKNHLDNIETQWCPYSKKKCYKIRKSNPDISIGTCSVQYKDESIIICPYRLLENNQIFIDCLHLLTNHEPGNELYIIPEVTIPGGHVDYFLVSAKSSKVKDFLGIELQTMDTTGTVWPERQKLLYENGFNVEPNEFSKDRAFGMNWKMTAKTILIQMHHKAETFEALNKHLVLIIQDPFYQYMASEFTFSHFNKNASLGDSVHIHSYDFWDTNEKMRLDLKRRTSTDAKGIALSLGLNATPQVDFLQLVQLLESRLLDEYRLTLW